MTLTSAPAPKSIKSCTKCCFFFSTSATSILVQSSLLPSFASTIETGPDSSPFVKVAHTITRSCIFLEHHVTLCSIELLVSFLFGFGCTDSSMVTQYTISTYAHSSSPLKHFFLRKSLSISSFIRS